MRDDASGTPLETITVERPSRLQRVIRLTALLAAATILAAITTVIGWRLAGPSESETPLGRVAFEVVADPFAGVDAYVPIADWGIRADAFEAPFRLDVEIRSLDRGGALEAAGGERDALQRTATELDYGRGQELA